MDNLLEKIKELLPIKIGDKFLAQIYKDKFITCVCNGYIVKDQLLLLDTDNGLFIYPNDVIVITGGDISCLEK